MLWLQLNSGADRHLAPFEWNSTARPNELHALGHLERRRYDLGIRCSACKLNGAAFRRRRGQGDLDRTCVVRDAVSFRLRRGKRPV